MPGAKEPASPGLLLAGVPAGLNDVPGAPRPASPGLALAGVPAGLNDVPGATSPASPGLALAGDDGTLAFAARYWYIMIYNSPARPLPVLSHVGGNE